MKFSKQLIASAVLLATSSAALAISNSTDINISVTQGEYINMTGTVIDNANLITLTVGDLDGNAYTLGTLGFNSNVSGTCDVEITTANDFELKDGSTSLSDYSVTYNGSTVTTNAGGIASPIAQSCTTVTDTDFDLTSTGTLPTTIVAGTYTDTISIEVTTP